MKINLFCMIISWSYPEKTPKFWKCLHIFLRRLFRENVICANRSFQRDSLICVVWDFPHPSLPSKDRTTFVQESRSGKITNCTHAYENLFFPLLWIIIGWALHGPLPASFFMPSLIDSLEVVPSPYLLSCCVVGPKLGKKGLESNMQLAIKACQTKFWVYFRQK